MPTKKELRLYGDLLYQHKPTIRTIVLKFLMDYFAKKNRYRKSPYINDTPIDDIVEKHIAMPEMSHFAIIKNNSVSEIIVVNPIIAETLRSKRIKFVEFSPTHELVYRGMEFKDGQFIKDETQEESENSVDDKKD